MYTDTRKSMKMISNMHKFMKNDTKEGAKGFNELQIPLLRKFIATVEKKKTYR